VARRKQRRSRVRDSGRQGLWVRHSTFTPSNVVTAPLYTEDAVVFPQLWEREQSVLTQPKRGAGGALLKRCFGSVAWEIRQSDAGSTIVAPNFEVLIFAASTEEPAASAAGDFDANLESQRILHYKMMGPTTSIRVTNTATQLTRWYATMHFDVKVAAKLPGQDIVLTTRCSETETAEVGIGVRAQFTAYLTTP